LKAAKGFDNLPDFDPIRAFAVSVGFERSAQEAAVTEPHLDVNGTGAEPRHYGREIVDIIQRNASLGMKARRELAFSFVRPDDLEALRGHSVVPESKVSEGIQDVAGGLSGARGRILQRNPRFRERNRRALASNQQVHQACLPNSFRNVVEDLLRQADDIPPSGRAGLLAVVVEIVNGGSDPDAYWSTYDRVERCEHASLLERLTRCKVEMAPGGCDEKDRGRVTVEPQVLVNPSFRLLSDEKARFLEGCLSVPGHRTANAAGEALAERVGLPPPIPRLRENSRKTRIPKKPGRIL
jgi:hypothetical protein